MSLPPWAWQLPNTQEYFSDTISSYVNKCDFWYCIMKCVSFGMIWITQQTRIFQMATAWCYKITHGWKIHQECKRDPWIFIEQTLRHSLTQFQSSHCSWPLKNYDHLSSFGVVTKNIQSYWKSLLGYFFFLLYICVRPDFPHLLQPTQPIPTDWMQKQIWESNWSQTLKRFAQCKIMTFSY